MCREANVKFSSDFPFEQGAGHPDLCGQFPVCSEICIGQRTGASGDLWTLTNRPNEVGKWWNCSRYLICVRYR